MIINNEDKLWRVIKEQQLKRNGTLKFTFFKDASGLSCDLAKLTNLQKMLNRKEFVSIAEKAGVREFDAATVRSAEIDSDVIHQPEPDNDAHCVFDINKPLDTHKCKLMVELSKNIKEPNY
jgi:hypothetical protein